MKKSTLILIILLLLSMVGNVVLCRLAHQKAQVVADTVTHVKEIPYYLPVPVDSIVYRYETKTLPANNHAGVAVPGEIRTEIVHDTINHTDSVLLEIPIEQKRYESDSYTAYVSGYHPQLDSIFIKQQTTIITKRTKPKKWSIGLGASYGIDAKGDLSPMIGVSVHYNLLDF